MKTCNATCHGCGKRFVGVGAGRAWAFCRWCRYKQHAREAFVELAYQGYRGLCIGAGFMLALLLARLMGVL